jgi:hypothetical protein
METNELDLWGLLRQTEILQMPKHVLATFAVTDIQYHFVGSLDTHQARLRQGTIKAEKPAIIMPGAGGGVLEGFDEYAQELLEQLGRLAGTDLRMLGYRFRNIHGSTTLENSTSEEIIVRLKDAAQSSPRTAILKGPDSAWQVGLLKLIIEHTRHSFSSNVKEFEEHGFFPGPGGLPDKVRWHIESLFRRAETQAPLLAELAGYLKEHGLFAEYEERFFSLVKRIRA